MTKLTPSVSTRLVHTHVHVSPAFMRWMENALVKLFESITYLYFNKKTHSLMLFKSQVNRIHAFYTEYYQGKV